MEKVLSGKMKNADFLDKILLQFVNFVIPEFREFQKAIEDFKKNVPDIILVLRRMIENSAKNNKKFIEKRNYFLEICKKNINLDISFFAIQEMIIQHILTDEIFASIFYESYFHRENNIAKELQKVVNTFFFAQKRRNILSKLQNYYVVIKRKAINISSNYEKQKFLKIIYENFYRSYNPKAADKLGIIYTPKEKFFFYVYAVFHNPNYRKKYEINLKRDFPRIPFYNNFEKWVKFGEKLMNLHLNFEDVKAYNLEIENKNLQNFPNVKLRFNKSKDEIFIDENTKLKNIPKIALEYKLGNRSALEWILN